MKAVILAGGFGTRLSEETNLRSQTTHRDRIDANNMAYHENLFVARDQRIHRLLRIQRVSNQRIFQ